MSMLDDEDVFGAIPDKATPGYLTGVFKGLAEKYDLGQRVWFMVTGRFFDEGGITTTELSKLLGFYADKVEMMQMTNDVILIKTREQYSGHA